MTRIPSVQLVECSRDAMQGWHQPIPTTLKIEYINALLKVGFHTLDFGSFVSSKAIPQMADTQQVLDGLSIPVKSKTNLLAIVANVRGAEAAAQNQQIQVLGFPFSISPTFQLRNTNSSMEQSMVTLKSIQEICAKNNKQLVIYLSMGFGNPYGDQFSIDLLLEWANKMVHQGVGIISLADTVGLATSRQINEALHALIPNFRETVFGVHLHATSINWQSKMDAALDAGCLRFDGAINGIGGCPMAQDQLVGNMDTLLMIAHLKMLGIPTNIHDEALTEAMLLAKKIFNT